MTTTIQILSPLSQDEVKKEYPEFNFQRGINLLKSDQFRSLITLTSPHIKQRNTKAYTNEVSKNGIIKYWGEKRNDGLPSKNKALINSLQDQRNYYIDVVVRIDKKKYIYLGKYIVTQEENKDDNKLYTLKPKQESEERSKFISTLYYSEK